ncbi:lysozyme inhibitor LprI family protein [Pseudoroseomonas globiformis]|uniref:Lysozyme inhibitor LprI family protein n=1 Tax=Teichococcus globiformis TaxID=2307229 RepID=A0ABV7FYN0_9PROT
MRGLVLAALLALGAAPAGAASLDCRRAATAAERMICADPVLSALDQEMAAAWWVAEANRRAGQREWLARRDRCADAACLAETYRGRIAALRPAATCREEAGTDQANEWVRQCIQVSPATHPPCNIANRCSLITDEIARGCGMIPAAERPAFCGR